MRYEQRKEFAAILSILSVAIALGAATVTIPAMRETVPLATGVATLIAAVAASLTIWWSRRLREARERRRVFLIYAREDVDAAKRIAHALRERGFNAWLDVEEIIPGQVWQKAVLRALEESVAALVLVSENLGKKGFVQEEIKAALGVLQQRAEDLSPVIPLRLSDVQVPESLSHIHWVNAFHEGGLDRLDAGLKRLTA